MLLLFKVFPWNHEHSKTLAVFLANVFVVHFVCPSYCLGVSVVGVAKQFETLVDKDIVNRKVRNAVGQNTKTDGQSDVKDVVFPQQEESNANNGVKRKKTVVAFKPAIVVFFVVVGVQMPEESVHDVFVAKPSHEFHDAKSGYKNQDV